MATSMFSNFASTDRRKKAVTYGKASRPPTISVPIPPSEDDAPAPERPRKNTAASNGSLKKPGVPLKVIGDSEHTKIRTEIPDTFEIPSEDELAPRAFKPAKKLQAKHKTVQANSKVVAQEKNIPKPGGGPSKLKSANLEVEPANSEVLTGKSSQKTAQHTQPRPEPLLSADEPVAGSKHRRKISQPIQKVKQNAPIQELEQQPKVIKKVTSMATTPALSVLKPPKGTKAMPSHLITKTKPEYRMNPSEDLNVYDVPSSDEEMLLPGRKPPRQSALAKVKKPNGSILDASRRKSAEFDEISTLKKRKRAGSISSSTTVRSVTERRKEPLIPQRNSKYQKKEGSISPGNGTFDQTESATAPSLPAINKPRRTRTRTVPMLTKPTITKGQSAPATLNSMLSDRTLSMQPVIPEVTEAASVEDETMYEIPDSLATPVRPTNSTVSSSITPHQKALFSSLLGDAASGTPMPKISTLQLTDQKPKSLLGALARSKSDLTTGGQIHKNRLIDTMKRAETSSDDEDEDDTSESQSDEEESDKPSSIQTPKPKAGQNPVPADIRSDDMDIDHETKAVSETSQTTTGFGTRSKLTYAMARSYLQEDNPEDALLMSMDLDDGLGLDKDNLTEDDEDPMSQVQARHELKRRGQQTAFQWETETLINDMSDKTSNSVRRSTMLELCTKMADKTFTIQLLESSLANQFFQNISSNGEIIFDFATASAVIFVLKTDPVITVLDQVHQTRIVDTLVKLTAFDADIGRIAKDRKTNLSKIAQESLAKFRALLQDSIWTSDKPEKISPQIVALRALELLSTCLRRAGSSAPLLGQDDVPKLVDISLGPSERLRSGKKLFQDVMTLNSLLLILESASVAKHKQPSWSIGTLQRLADLLPMFFQPDATSSTMLAVKLCMNLTNNKPKACQPFSGSKFVEPLVSSIIHKFEQLESVLKQEQRTEVLETLILSLGAMINLAELNDLARVNVDDGKQVIEKLVKIFVEGSERAAKANSMEESHSSVAVGYLTVLLGNLCLNSQIRSKVRAQLPKQQLGMLIEKIKEFLKFHERIEGKDREFEASEDKDARQNYTSRLRLVVDKLTKAEI